MTPYSQMVLAGVALVVAFWPQIKAASAALIEGSGWLHGRTVPPSADDSEAASSAVSYQTSILYLAEVRTRLKATNLLDDQRKAAIDTLTLALVEGSDQP